MKLKSVFPTWNGRRYPAFTLVEMLVVIGIIVILIGLLLPMITRAYRNAERARVKADFGAITSALDAYKQDMGQYPQVPVGGNSAVVLCRALIAPEGAAIPGDWADGDGFRTRPPVNGVQQSKVYGPYLDRSKFKLGTVSDANSAADASTMVVLDRYKRPILYFPANPGKPNVRVAGGYLAANKTAMYDWRDGTSATYDDDGNVSTPPIAAFTHPGGDPSAPEKRIQFILGDINANGMIDGSETAVNEPFLLWSTGPDEQYGPDASNAEPVGTLDVFDLPKCDDVTNFRD